MGLERLDRGQWLKSENSYCFTEFLDPFQRVIQPEEIWLYKNPLVQSDNIPTRLMFAISFLTPLAVICVVKIIRRTDKTEIKEAFLAVSLALALNGVCTNTIKLIVGRILMLVEHSNMGPNVGHRIPFSGAPSLCLSLTDHEWSWQECHLL
ncbi:Plpp4 [Phodopus roborovskii]|uniref:Plpp4 protein n=1 Tax=Phodopus roborovskii TaxID=109678 RepID=A0AAU9ZMF1_PHORO|nr:Plpp4 [Phodopus roborovskii]